MEPVTFALLQQIQILKRKTKLPTLPPGAVLDLISTAPKPDYLTPMDGSMSTLDRATYVDLDAIIGLQSNLQSVSTVPLPGGYVGPLYWIGDGFSTNDGRLFWWDQQAGSLVPEQIGNAYQGPCFVLATTLPGWGRDSEHAALVMSYPSESSPHLEFYHATGANHATWTKLPDTFFPLYLGNYDLFTSAPDCVKGDRFYAAALDASGYRILFYVKDICRNVGRMYAWYTYTPGDPGALVPVDGISPNDFGGFVSPIMPVLAGYNQISVVGDMGIGEMIKLRAFHADGDVGSSEEAYPNMVMFNDRGFPLAWGQGNGGSYYFVVPPVSTKQRDWSYRNLKNNVYRQVDLQGRYPGIDYLMIYGSSWSRSNENVGYRYHLTGGQKRVTVEGTSYNYPLLLASYGFRNFTPITHAAFNSMAEAKFRSGMPISDPTNQGFDCTLMHLELANGNGQLFLISMGGDAGIPVPTSTPPAGMSRYIYPGRVLDDAQPGSGGGGVG